MASKTILIGNVGGDPEMRYAADGTPVATLSLATTETWKNKAGEKQEKTSWHNLVFWRGLAELVEKYVKKGNKIYVAGTLDYRSWEHEGKKHYKTEIVVKDIEFLTPKSSGNYEQPPVPDEPPPGADQDVPF